MKREEFVEKLNLLKRKTVDAADCGSRIKHDPHHQELADQTEAELLEAFDALGEKLDFTQRLYNNDTAALREERDNLQAHAKFAEKCAVLIEVLPDLKSHPDLVEAYKTFQVEKPDK